MSAAEIIEQIKALPSAEVEVIRHFLSEHSEEVRHLDTRKALEISAGIFDRNVDLFRKLAQ